MSYSVAKFSLLKTEFKNFREKYVKELAWVFGGQVAMILLGIVSIKLLTTMSKGDFGKYNLVLSLAALSSSLLYGPAEQGFVRFYFEYKKISAEYLFFKTVVRFLIYAAVFISLMFILLYGVNGFIAPGKITQIQFRFIELINIVFFIAISLSNTLFNSILNVLRKRQMNTLFSITEKIITLLLFILILFLSKLDVHLVLLAMTTSTSIFVLLKYFKIKSLFLESVVTQNETTGASVKSIEKQIIVFCLPFVLWGITGWIQISSDKFIISSYLNIGNVGIYSLILTISSYLISTPINIISQFIQPVIYDRILGSQDAENIKQGYKFLNYALLLIILLISSLCVFTIFFGDSLILLLSNSNYLYHINLLPLVCLGVGIFQLAQFYTTFGFIKNKPNIYLPSKLISGVIAVALNIYLINRYQLLGIAIASLLVSTIYFLLVIYANHRIGIKLFSNA